MVETSSSNLVMTSEPDRLARQACLVWGCKYQQLFANNPFFCFSFDSFVVQATFTDLKRGCLDGQPPDSRSCEREQRICHCRRDGG